jgi:hypothetical protein
MVDNVPMSTWVVGMFTAMLIVYITATIATINVTTIITSMTTPLTDDRIDAAISRR